MRITTLTITKSRTINMGNFESVRVEFGATCELDHNEHHDTVAETLDTYVTKELEARCPVGAAVTIQQTGKPVRLEAAPQDTPTQEELQRKRDAIMAEAGTNAPVKTPVYDTVVQDAPAPRKRVRRSAAQIEADAVAAYRAKVEGSLPLAGVPQGLAEGSPQLAEGRTAIGRQPKGDDGPRPGLTPTVGRTVGATSASVTWPDVHAALTKYSRAAGPQALVKLIVEHTGQPNLMAIKAEHWASLYAAAGGDPLGKAA